jgi:hypothetical protein
VSPSGTLGDANDAVFWKRANIERWVDMGTRDATQVLHRLKSVPPLPTTGGTGFSL